MEFLPLQPHNPALVDFIRQHIRAAGPVSFAWFMEQALYHPEHGYYSSGRADIGRAGDYFTNVSVGSIFGTLWAAQFAQAWERLDRRDDFVVVEQGAHDGRFAHDVLRAARIRSPEFFSVLRYRIIEPFEIWKSRQAETLRDFANKIQWATSFEQSDPFVGVHFSNELLDAMPFHLVCHAGLDAEWSEQRVDWRDDKFVLIEQPIVDRVLQRRVKALPPLPTGYETELNLTISEWVSSVATKIQCGFAFIVDYGFVREDFYALHRASGTMQCRAQHRLLDSPFAAVGTSDITAHVDWTNVAEQAESHGLQIAGFTDQHHFLTGLISEWPDLTQNIGAQESHRLQTLLHPEMLGRTFQVLALAKDVDEGVKLAGLKFGRDARQTLGL